jgi:hypothetical protein
MWYIRQIYITPTEFWALKKFSSKFEPLLNSNRTILNLNLWFGSKFSRLPGPNLKSGSRFSKIFEEPD